jgi:hypothetical protein
MALSGKEKLTQRRKGYSVYSSTKLVHKLRVAVPNLSGQVVRQP